MAKLRTIRSGLSGVKCIKDKSSMSQPLGDSETSGKVSGKEIEGRADRGRPEKGTERQIRGLSPETSLCGTTDGWGTKAEGNA